MDGLAPGKLMLDMYEEMTFGCFYRLYHVGEAAVAPKAECFETSPLEPRHAEDESGSEAGLEELHPETFTLLSAGEDEDRVRFFRVSGDVEKRWECHFGYDDT